MELSYQQKYRRTVLGKISSTYLKIISRSKEKGYDLPEFKKYEFFKFCLNSELFLELFKKWEKSNFEKDLAPSIDRIDDYKGYNFDNIRVVTWKENNEDGVLKRKNKLNNKGRVKVDQLCIKTGKIIKTYDSIVDCAYELGLQKSNISKVLKGTRNSTGGYKFKYNEIKKNNR